MSEDPRVQAAAQAIRGIHWDITVEDSARRVIAAADAVVGGVVPRPEHDRVVAAAERVAKVYGSLPIDHGRRVEAMAYLRDVLDGEDSDD